MNSGCIERQKLMGIRDEPHTTGFPMNPIRFRCPKTMHLCRSEDFARIYAGGQRAGDQYLLIFATANELNLNRLGLSISRKHGSAVLRNRKRRRIREAFRGLQHDLPKSYDLVVVPRMRDDLTLQDFRNSLRTLIRKLAKRLSAAQDNGGDSSQSDTRS